MLLVRALKSFRKLMKQQLLRASPAAPSLSCLAAPAVELRLCPPYVPDIEMPACTCLCSMQARLMGPPNVTWQQILAQAHQNPEVLKQQVRSRGPGEAGGWGRDWYQRQHWA